MIKINSFIPVNNFMRKSWEFHDDHLVIRTKSLTVDYENEVKYKKIKSIQSRRITDLNWIWASFFTTGLLASILWVLNWLHIHIPNFEIIIRIIMIFALAMLFPAFRRHEYYSFLDADQQDLATVRVNQKNKPSLFEAIKLVREKAQITTEIYFDDPLPSTTPMFQFTEFDFADFLNRSTVRIYEDKIIDIEKSLAEEVTTVIKFDESSGETKFAKMSNDKWDYVWSYWLFFVGITGFSVAVFFTKQMKGNDLILNLFLGSLALLIPLYFFRYIKSEVLFFFDKRDHAVFWTRVSSANQEKLNQIVEFIKGKTTTVK